MCKIVLWIVIAQKVLLFFGLLQKCQFDVVISAPPNQFSSSPSSECCDYFASAFYDSSTCLCYLVNEPLVIGFPLNATRINSLSSICLGLASDGDSVQSVCDMLGISPPPSEVPPTGSGNSPSPSPSLPPSSGPSPVEEPTCSPSPGPSPVQVPTSSSSPGPSPVEEPTSSPSPGPSPVEAPTSSAPGSATDVNHGCMFLPVIGLYIISSMFLPVIGLYIISMFMRL